MSSDVEHIFICLLVIFIYSVMKCLFKRFTHVFIGLFIFLLLSCKSLLYILDTSLFPDKEIAKSLFSKSIACLSIF